ncbi:hypothetical protein LJC08_06020 [Methanimicrococcus sp. OttesenSCG-928-J09]|nr:hypothetical protein [Methanimicrococcus sp. OttesenSCG-928-J09]
MTLTVPQESIEKYPSVPKVVNSVQELLGFDSVTVSKRGDSFELRGLSEKSCLTLLYPLELTVYFDNELYIIENDLFEIFSYDKIFKDALIDFEIQFYDLWEDFVRAEESRLAPSGIVLKKLLQTYLEEKCC